jgi:hypothetical protein
MKKLSIVLVLLLAGCASNPDLEKSISRDKTAESLAKAGLLAEMLKSDDPIVRSQAAKTADQFINKPKGLFGN